MKLRGYQNSAVSGITSEFHRGCRSVCLVAPTGSGKTVVMSHIAQGMLPRRTLILVHRQELVDQTSRTLAECGVQHGIIAAGYPKNYERPVQVASIQSLARRDTGFEPSLIVVDEAHHAVAGTWSDVIDAHPQAYVLGLTATPVRGDGKDLGSIFQSIVRGPEVQWLMDNDFLVTPRYYAPPPVADLDGLRTHKGDYKLKDLGQAMDKPTVVGDAIEHYKRLASGSRAVAFCVDIAHCESTVQAFTGAGISAAMLDGKMSADARRATVELFGLGGIEVLVNCGIVSEGFDIPAASTAILLRPTQSLALHLQQLGRVLRPCEGKADAVVLDHVGNLARHGLAEDWREWSIDSVKTKRKVHKDPLAKFRQCPACYATHAPAPVCPHCGHTHGTQKELETAEGELKELERGSKSCPSCGILYGIHLKQCPRCAPEERAEARSKDDLVALAKRRGYKNPYGWAMRILSARKSKKKK